MDETFINELYHQLRLLCVQGGQAEKDAIMGLTSHLTRPQGDYQGLVSFLSYYGTTYLLERVYQAVSVCSINYTRIVELGSGLGWLGTGLASMAGGIPVVLVDKRPWYGITNVLADIELKADREEVLWALRAGDLIVMSELLHCLDDPIETLKPFLLNHPCVIVEYCPGEGSKYTESYRAQVLKFGCSLVDMHEVQLHLGSLGVTHKISFIFPHVVVVTYPPHRREQLVS